MDTRQEKQRSIDAINCAIREFRQDSYIEPPTDAVSYGEYKKLTRLQIDQGVIAFVHACNLRSGSVVDVDLYKLLRCYLQSEEARHQMNFIIEQTLE